LATPEPAFAARVPPPEPERPWPSRRRAIFLDVENNSRAEHIARTLDHLAIDRRDRRTDFVAVGNWRVIGADSARLLARHGAQLVHSAPSVGVRDWSDLRIAVSAGVWLGAARPGDVLEVVSDDRAFDAVGDVATSLGIDFRRLSYRALSGGPASHESIVQAPSAEPRGRRGRRRGRRGRAGVAPAPTESVRYEPPVTARPEPPAGAGGAPHTAPHDEIVEVVRELVERAPDRAVLIDTLANALKARGFRRTPGSPRLITRLRRIREVTVSPTGMITVIPAGESDGGEPGTWPEPAEAPAQAVTEGTSGDETPREGGGRRRRRSRRRGRRRRRGGAPAPVSGA
jgi:hypothetical protein